MTANVITYRGRSAMREMGKVLNLPQDVIERSRASIRAAIFPHTLTLEEQIRRAGMPQQHRACPRSWSPLPLTYGLPRHLGQHSGGMVHLQGRLDKIVPLEPASMPGRVVVQWDKDDCEDLGIIKVDLLGLGMMAAIEETIELSAARGRPVDLAQIPPDDPACFELMQKADTVGVFQIESRAQMATLPRMKPTCFYDVVVEVAIIRPGPIVGKMVHPYLNRRSGKEPIDFIHPDFELVLGRTLGVPLFQEQVLKMAMIIADFTGSEAEELRRAMSFHRSEERMTKALDKLAAAMTRKSVDPVIQDRIVKSIRSFALYGFPESHAISFALLAYASVWLKVHRAAEFYAALLNCQPMGFYSSATLVRDGKQHGMRILPACVIASEIECTVIDDSTLRLGLNQLRGISRHALETLMQQRRLRPWQDLDDLLRRCALAKDERRVFAQAGALNALGHHRRSALWQVEAPLHDDLFTQLEFASESPLPMMTPGERLESDYHTTTLTVGPHPMALIRPQIPRAITATGLNTKRHGQRVVIVGMVICRQRPGTANGHCFLSLEDETGIANAFVPSDLFEKRRLPFRFGAAAFPEVILRIGVVGEEGVELFGEVGAGGFGAGLAEEVEAFLRVGLHVVELVGAVGEAGDVFPAFGADGAGGFHFVEDGVVPVGELLAAQGGGEVAAGGFGLLRHFVSEAEVAEDAGEEVVVADEGVAGLGGGDLAGLAEDERDLHHELVRAGGAEVVAHAPHAVLAAHPALVGGIDDEGVFIEAVGLERGEDFADAVVHAGGLGGAALHGGLGVVELLVGPLPGMHGVAGKLVKGLSL
jgi:error-prone DNA polymerase